MPALRRREFITLLGGVAAWPFAARAQQRAVPVIGFLAAVSSDGFTDRLRAFREGLKQTGFGEGENIAIEYRWAENQLDRLPALAADSVGRRAAVIVSTREPAWQRRIRSRTTLGASGQTRCSSAMTPSS